MDRARRIPVNDSCELIMNIQWCNENEGRAYPVREDADRLARSGAQLPNNLITDMRIMLPREYDSVYVSSAWLTNTLCGISLSCNVGPLCSAVVYLPAYEVYSAVPLEPMPGVHNVSGWVSFGTYRSAAHRNLIFDPGHTDISEHAKSIVCDLPVTNIRRLNGEPADAASGLVHVEPGSHMKIYGEQDNSIVPLEPMPGVHNVSGWVSFGTYRSAAHRNLIFDPGHTDISEHAKSIVCDLPVTNIRRLNGEPADAASGLVHVEPGSHMKIYGEQDNSIVFAIDPAEASALFAGPCYADISQEEGCGAPVLQSINGVRPDAEGIITIEFD